MRFSGIVPAIVHSCANGISKGGQVFSEEEVSIRDAAAKVICRKFLRIEGQTGTQQKQNRNEGIEFDLHKYEWYGL